MTPAHDAAAGNDWWQRAADAIPGGSSTGSKRPEALFGACAGGHDVPTHYERAAGCMVVTTSGQALVDCTMALGAVAIGYADPAVTRAVHEAAAAGPVSGLPHRLEVEVAERLIDCIPCAEQVRFLRTGAEATAAAVRIARAATARTHVIACGYFGWLDWNSGAAGVPSDVTRHVTWIPYDDVEALERAVRERASELAAIVIEPLIHEVASVAWLAATRAACDRTGAVLILDEIKTAFRVRTGGVQELTGIIPDLATIGKALANGYPLAAVVGRAAVMEAATRTWISSTAAAEATGLAAAQAVIEWHERVDVPARLAATGRDMQAIVREALDRAPWLGVRAEGPPWMWQLTSDTPAALDTLVHAAARGGVLLKRGAYQFAAIAHDRAALDLLGTRLAAVIADLPPTP